MEQCCIVRAQKNPKGRVSYTALVGYLIEITVLCNMQISLKNILSNSCTSING